MAFQENCLLAFLAWQILDCSPVPRGERQDHELLLMLLLCPCFGSGLDEPRWFGVKENRRHGGKHELR